MEQTEVLTLIETAGPFNIQQLKEETGLLVKQLTPILHRLQEAFLIYEDQYDGQWDRGILVPRKSGYLLKSDLVLLEHYEPRELRSVYALHRNDFLYKIQEPSLKQMVKDLTQGLPYDCEPLQYLLIDGRICGAAVGHFRYGPYDLNDIVCNLPDAENRKEEILQAVMEVNPGGELKRFMGRDL